MQTIFKHPGSDLVAVADFSLRLAEGESLAEIVDPPVVVSGDDALEIGDASINGGSTVLLPNGEPPVPQGAGVLVPLRAGNNKVRYIIRLVVKTTADEEIAKDLEVVIGNQY